MCEKCITSSKFSELQDPVDLGWKPTVRTWLQRLPKDMPDTGKHHLQALFDHAIDRGFQFLEQYSKHLMVPTPALSVIACLCNILAAFFDFMAKNGGFGLFGILLSFFKNCFFKFSYHTYVFDIDNSYCNSCSILKINFFCHKLHFSNKNVYFLNLKNMEDPLVQIVILILLECHQDLEVTLETGQNQENVPVKNMLKQKISMQVKAQKGM